MTPRLVVPLNDKDHLIGYSNAPVTLVEYGDYQCATCKLFVPMVKRLRTEIGSPLCFAFRHFPLKKAHPYAQEAAIASEAAALQNKFWDMHELLYAKQLEMGPGLFDRLAEQLLLNREKFQKDCSSPEIIHKVEEEFKTGVLSGVNGTPCFYINEERYDGDATFEGLKTQITSLQRK